MFTGIELGKMISSIFYHHECHSRKPEKAFRKFDGRTPYGVHPTLAAMLILHEEYLLEDVRVIGAKALLAHDLIEDTKIARLPDWCYQPLAIASLVYELTFYEDQDPSVEIWKRSDKAKLLKFYDVTVNLMCVSAMKPERVQYCREQAQKHLAWVEERYPHLEIVKIAKGLLA